MDFKIKDLPCTERPYERYLCVGASELSNTELLALILRSGSKDKNVITIASEIIKLLNDGENLAELINISEAELCSIKGIGRIKAAQLICIGELAKRISLSKAKRGLDFNCSATIAEYYMERLRHLQNEIFVLAMLDSKCRLIKDKFISVGSINSTLVSPREIFKEAFRYNAACIVVLHNHPSGDSRPSDEDLAVTGRLVQAGQVLGLRVMDHLVIGNKEYYSFREKGIIS